MKNISVYFLGFIFFVLISCNQNVGYKCDCELSGQEVFLDDKGEYYWIEKDTESDLLQFGPYIEPSDGIAVIRRCEELESRCYLAHYTEAIRLDPEDAVAYHSRGSTKADLEDYTGAISDYTEAIRLDPDEDYKAFAYCWRGRAKKSAGLSYCSDYKKACDLGYDKGCGYYDEQCK